MPRRFRNYLRAPNPNPDHVRSVGAPTHRSGGHREDRLDALGGLEVGAAQMGNLGRRCRRIGGLRQFCWPWSDDRARHSIADYFETGNVIESVIARNQFQVSAKSLGGKPGIVLAQAPSGSGLKQAATQSIANVQAHHREPRCQFPRCLPSALFVKLRYRDHADEDMRRHELPRETPRRSGLTRSELGIEVRDERRIKQQSPLHGGVGRRIRGLTTRTRDVQ